MKNGKRKTLVPVASSPGSGQPKRQREAGEGDRIPPPQCGAATPEDSCSRGTRDDRTAPPFPRVDPVWNRVGRIRTRIRWLTRHRIRRQGSLRFGNCRKRFQFEGRREGSCHLQWPRQERRRKGGGWRWIAVEGRREWFPLLSSTLAPPQCWVGGEVNLCGFLARLSTNYQERWNPSNRNILFVREEIWGLTLHFFFFFFFNR